MPVYELTINDKLFSVDVPADMPLLWIIRDEIGLTGTKYGCGVGSCGSCTVLVNGEPVFSCQYVASLATGKKITTIEGLDPEGQHPVQKAWTEVNVPQCGYCQPGQMLTAAALLKKHPHPTDEQVNEEMQKVVCRCGTYYRIRRAIHKASEYL